MGTNLTPQERLIVALDFADADAALRLVAALGETVVFYKVGLELFAAGCGRALIDELKKRGRRVLADLKLFDVPETVARATAQIANSGADFLTIHGNDAMLQAAVAAKGKHLKILAVTALTSLDRGDLQDLGFACDTQQLVLSRARRALAEGCDGVVASGQEVAALRQQAGDQLLLVTPGVRPVENCTDDQKRTATPAQIIAAGGDYLVVGRPVRDAANPQQAAQAIIGEIDTAATTL